MHAGFSTVYFSDVVALFHFISVYLKLIRFYQFILTLLLLFVNQTSNQIEMQRSLWIVYSWF